MLDRCRQLIQLFLDQADLGDQQATVVTVSRGAGLVGLRVGLRAKEVLSCEESVNFSLKELHSFSQDLRFGGEVTQLAVFEGEGLLTHCEGTLGQLKVEAALGQSRP